MKRRRRRAKIYEWVRGWHHDECLPLVSVLVADFDYIFLSKLQFFRFSSLDSNVQYEAYREKQKKIAIVFNELQHNNFS